MATNRAAVAKRVNPLHPSSLPYSVGSRPPGFYEVGKGAETERLCTVGLILHP